MGKGSATAVDPRVMGYFKDAVRGGAARHTLTKGTLRMDEAKIRKIVDGSATPSAKEVEFVLGQLAR